MLIESWQLIFIPLMSVFLEIVLSHLVKDRIRNYNVIIIGHEILPKVSVNYFSKLIYKLNKYNKK